MKRMNVGLGSILAGKDWSSSIRRLIQVAAACLLSSFALSIASGANFVVEMRNFSFVPRDLVIDRGDSVNWTNLDNAFHDTVSGVGGVASGIWRGPLIGRGGSFTFTFDVAPGRYDYYCTPHVGLGMAGSISVRLPAERPAIVTQPQSRSVFPGESVTFSVAATGAAPLQYEWTFQGTTVSGATSDTFTLSDVTTNHAGIYSVIVRNTAGSVASAPAVLTVLRRTNAPPTVALVAPADGTRVPFGTSLTLEAAASTPAGLLTRIEFFANSEAVGMATQPPYRAAFVPLQVGDLLLEAVATDDLGQTGTSAPVRVRVFLPENRPPTLRITRSPANYSRLKKPFVVLEGTATDETGVDRVEFQVNGGPFLPAAGTSVWQAEAPLNPGNNIVLVRAVDWAGNPSLPHARYFTVPATAEVRVDVIGEGEVTPNLAGRALQIGKVYVIKAVPSRDHLFRGWSGGASGTDARLSFQMEPDLALTATFVPNPFPPLAGHYLGLFGPEIASVAANAGAFRLALRPTGRFTGTLSTDGRTHRFQGAFNPGGRVQVALPRRGLRPLVVQMQLDSTLGEIAGTVTDGTWTALLHAARSGAVAASAATMAAGSHHFVIDSAHDEASNPLAAGTITVRSTGAIHVRGVAQGHTFSFASHLTQTGAWPFYTSLSGEWGVIMGWVGGGDANSLSFEGDLVQTSLTGKIQNVTLRSAVD